MRPPPTAAIDRRDDGTTLVRSEYALALRPPLVIDVLEAQARAIGDRVFLAERDADGAWRRTSYAAFEARTAALATGLMRAGVAIGDRVAIVAENSIDHAAVAFAAMRCGATATSLSTTLAALPDSAPFARLAAQVGARVVFFSSARAFVRAVEIIARSNALIVTGDGDHGIALASLAASIDRSALSARRAQIDERTPAKLFFTSGSTGSPKGVINTHGNLAAGMAMYGQVADTSDAPLALLDWLPWSHVYGGNVQVHEVLRAGGTLTIDAGRPTPERFAQTLANLREVSPTLYGSVPAAFAMLATALEADTTLRDRFFTRLRGLRYGGGALPQETFERMQALAHAATGRAIGFSSGWGMTETSGCGVSCYWDVNRAGMLGLPLPGVTLKLVPIDAERAERAELRIRGPQVFAGYLAPIARAIELEPIAQAFDDEGYFRTGDAVVWADPAQPLAGLAFAGRLAEQFKLATGTWVQAGSVRIALLDALAPLAREVVVAAPDRPWLGALVWVEAATLHDAPRRQALAALLARYNAGAGGSSRRIERVVLVEAPLSIAQGEITDKRTVNQRRVLERRADTLAQLYADPPPANVLVVQ